MKKHLHRLRRHKHIVIPGIILIPVVLFVGWLFMKDQQYSKSIYPNVKVNNVNVEGKTKEQVVKLFKPDTDKLRAVNFYFTYKDQTVATISAQQINLKTNIDDIALQSFLIGRSPHFPTKVKERFLTLTGLGTYTFTTSMQYDEKPFEEFIKLMADSYNKPAKNALFTFEEGKVSAFEADEKGLAINTKQFKADVEKALKEVETKPINKTIALKDTVVNPEITLAKANKFGIEEMIGEGVSNYSGSSEDRAYNVVVGAAKFNGVLIPPNEEFSFNKIVGDISSNTGFRPALVIKEGKTVLGDGGGICQVSTTAFRAAMNTGLPILERHAHAYRVHYYENDAKPGFDATIYTPTVDFKFLNDTPAYILVQTEVEKDKNLVHFRFYGKRDNRKVELSDATVWDVQPAPPDKMQDDPGLPNGTIKQVEYAAPGAKSKITYKVVKDGKISFQKDFISVYRPWQAVFLVGKGS
jgi:vancomycin resistance protein YoaR